MNKIDETIANMITENNHLGGKTMENVYNTANDVLPENAAAAETTEPEDYRVDGILYCGKCRTPKEIFLLEEQTRQLGLRSNLFSVRCECSRAKVDEKDARAKELAHKKKVEQLKKDCFGTASALIACTFENADGMDEKMERVITYVKDFKVMLVKGRGIIIWGGMGTGKTYTAACIANALTDQGYSVIMTNFARILAVPFEKQEEYFERLSSCDLLIIDDFGTERDTPYAQEQIFKVIDSRYLSEKPIIITTNLTMEDFKNPQNEAEERVFERLLERCMPICFGGENRRQAIALQMRKEMTKLLTGESV